jgi:hypothetical protein
MIDHVLDVIGTITDSAKPFLIVGKGPSSARWDPDMGVKFNAVGINQAALQIDARIAAFIDYEPWVECGSRLSNRTGVIMPWVPHWREQPGFGNLMTYGKFDRHLDALARLGMLMSYDLRTTHERNWPTREVVQAYASTTEAVVHILAMHGIRKIFTLGIDGGMGRAPKFADSYRTHEGDYSRQDYGWNLLKEKYNLEVEKL